METKESAKQKACPLCNRVLKQLTNLRLTKVVLFRVVSMMTVIFFSRFFPFIRATKVVIPEVYES